MPFRPLLAAAFSLVLSGQTTHYRQWMGGREVGGAEDTVDSAKGVTTIRHHEWIELDRFGLGIRQDLAQTATKASDGSIRYSWSVKLSNMPLEGTGHWSPSRPGTLHTASSGGAEQMVAVPMGAILWPGDEDAALMKAAKGRAPLSFSSFSFPTATWALRDLKPVGPDPLPGFPDAVKFAGTDTEGGTSAPVELWASPGAGELKEHSRLGGLDLWLQRAELPPPAGPEQASLFDRSVQPLPPDPFRAWRPEVTVRHAGGAAPDLPDTAQQKKIAPATWRLTRAAPPDAAEAAELPGSSSREDAPYLAATPLVQFKDPAFNGLLARMALKPGLSRWQLAQAVTDFVFTFIREKDYSVGFASALEVCRNPKGDCTEHGVLAVALLRKLGVPARGVLGWVAIDRTLGMHFWVEVELKGRWVPVDPTLDEAPASAFHIALGSTDLANLGSLGWDRLLTALGGGTFTTVGDSVPATAGNSVLAPDGTRLTWAGARWSVEQGILTVATPDRSVHTVLARTRPIENEEELEGARKLQGARTRRTGWWNPKNHRLFMDLGHRRWLQLGQCTEAQAFRALDALEVH